MAARTCKKSRNLRFGLFNAQSLGTKHDEFLAALTHHDPDILAINETWLHEGQDAKAPAAPGYRLRHTPRPRTLAGRGGGVGFYVKEELHTRVRAHPPLT